jgi:hypothetical protein
MPLDAKGRFVKPEPESLNAEFKKDYPERRTLNLLTVAKDGDR